MNKTKLTLRVNSKLLKSAKLYAIKHNTTISRLVTEFFRSLGLESTNQQTPLLRKLTGILDPSTNPREYQKHSEKKYLEYHD